MKRTTRLPSGVESRTKLGVAAISKSKAGTRAGVEWRARVGWRAGARLGSGAGWRLGAGAGAGARLGAGADHLDRECFLEARLANAWLAGKLHLTSARDPGAADILFPVLAFKYYFIGFLRVWAFSAIVYRAAGMQKVLDAVCAIF